MIKSYTEEMYRIWACDNQVYGPIEFPLLLEWVREGRVLRDTWVYLESNKEWRSAQRIDPLREEFPPGEETLFLRRQAEEGLGIAPEDLRQFAVLAGLANHEE